MREALTGLAIAAVLGLASLIVMLGRVVTAYLRVREAQYDRMLARRGESTPPPTVGPPGPHRGKRPTLGERIFVGPPRRRVRRDTKLDGGENEK